MKFSALYKNSFTEAKAVGEIEKWRQSHDENIRCRDFLDEQMRQYYSGFHLDSENIIQNSVAEFGFDRTMWVLANHVQYHDYDGRFSSQNKTWARDFYIPRPEDWEKQRDPYLRDHNTDYLLNGHNTLVDALVNKVRSKYAGLNLYDHRHCETGDIHTKDFKDRLLILRADVLKEAYRTPENQLFLADIGGFGCSPNARGRSVMGHFLADGEQATFNRQDFCGVADPEQLPEWAAVKLYEMQHPAAAPEESEGQSMPGMKGM